MPLATSRLLLVAPDERRRLVRRYRRLLKFDQALCLAYCTSAGVPLWSLWKTKREWAFHITGALFILVIGIAGLVVDRLVLAQAPRAEAKSYCVTVGFVISRLVLGVWAVAITHTQTKMVFGMIVGIEPHAITFPELATATVQMLLSPPVVILAFILGSYRILYHISVHFYLRLHFSVRHPPPLAPIGAQ